jgi:hypothetical protein
MTSRLSAGRGSTYIACSVALDNVHALLRKVAAERRGVYRGALRRCAKCSSSRSILDCKGGRQLSQSARAGQSHGGREGLHGPAPTYPWPVHCHLVELLEVGVTPAKLSLEHPVQLHHPPAMCFKHGPQRARPAALLSRVLASLLPHCLSR